MFRYLGMYAFCDATFILYMVSWVITRHGLFILVIKATWQAKYMIPRVWDPARGHYMTKEIFYGFFGMLVSLQVRIFRVVAGLRIGMPAEPTLCRLSNSFGSG